MTAAGDTVSLRLKLRYPDLDAFIERYAENVSSAGLFLRTKAPKPAGTRIRFELSLADETPALVGVGVVVAVRSEAPEGMAVRFRDLEGESRAVVDRIVASHGNGSLAPTPLSLDLGGRGSSSLDGWGSAEWSTADVARGRDWSDSLGTAGWPSLPTPTQTPPPAPTSAAPEAPAAAPERLEPKPPSGDAPSEAAPPEPPKRRIASIGLVPAGQLPPRREGKPAASAADPASPAEPQSPAPAESTPTPDPTDEAPATPPPAAPWEAEPTTTFSETPFEVDVVSHLSGIEPPADDAPLAQALPPFEFERESAEPKAAPTDEPSSSAVAPDERPTGDVAPMEPATAPREATVEARPAEASSEDAGQYGDDIDATRSEDVGPTEPTADMPAASRREPSIQPIPKSARPPAQPAEDSTELSADAAEMESTAPGSEPAEPTPPASEVAERAAPAAEVMAPTESTAETSAAAHPDAETVPASAFEPEVAPPSAPAVAQSAEPDAPAEAEPGPAAPTPRPEAGPGRRNVVERITADLDAQTPSKDLPVEMALAIGIDLGARWVRGGYIERGEMRWLTLGSSVPWSALVAARPDGTLAVGPRARRIADTTPERAISPMEVLTSIQNGAPAERFPISGWGPEGGVVTLGEHRFEFYDLLLAFARGVRETFVAELPREDFKAFIAMPAALEPSAAGMLRSAVREAGFEHPDFHPVGESLVRAFGLDDRSVDDVLIVHVEETHTLVAIAQRSGRHLTVTSSEVLRDVSTQAIDAAATQLVLDSLEEQHGEDHREDAVALRRIEEALDFARGDLRRSPTIDLRVTLSSSSGAAGVGVERTIQVSRSLLFSKTEPLASRLHERILALSNDRHIDPTSVGAVIVSGPGGVYPPFAQVAEQLCEQPPLGSLPPPLAMAVGLARWGRSQTQSDVAKRPDTLDASVGIELPGGRFRPLLPAGAQLPLRFKRQQPVRPHGGQVELRLHQGDSEYVKGCRYLGALVIGPILEDDRGTIKIELDMEVDVEGVLKARISEPSTGLKGQLVTATQQTPDERRKTMPPPPTPPPPQAPSAGESASPEGGFLKRLFGRRS